MLRVRLIGGITLELDGRGCEPPRSRRGRALLAWLALHPGEHSRAAVAAHFWPDVLDQSARASLRTALTELRMALRSGAGCLQTTRESVCLAGDEHELWVDSRAFTALLAAGDLAGALLLGSGELLTGVEDEWVLEARQEHNRTLAGILDTLADRAQQAGDFAAAVRHMRAAVALDPLDEEAHRRLIGHLAHAGENAGALSAYEELAARFRQTLGIMPSPATRALAEQIRRESRAAWSASAVPLPRALVQRRESRFVGRGRELERLRSAWEAVRSHGTRRLVALAGEPGVGKTRLAQQFADEVAGREALVLFGRCWEEPLAGYAPILDVLRQVEEAIGAVAIESLAGPAAGELARLLGSTAGATTLEHDAGSRHRLFDAVDAVLTALAVERPTLCVLDDLHWADRPTLLLLTFVLRSRRSGPMLMLGTYRDTELGRHSPLVGTLADMHRDGVTDRVAVRGLGGSEIASLAESWLGADGHRMAVQIHERTGGNALFVEEVLRSVVEHGEATVPESIRQAVGARLSGLSSSAIQLLDVAAVLGDELQADILAGASGLQEGEAENGLDEVLRARLLQPSSRSTRAFEFTHALVREVIYGELNALRRIRLHRVVAEHLIKRDAERHTEEIAQHLFEAADDDQERTVAFLTRAGQRSMKRLAYEAAAVYFEQALQLTGEDAGLLHERGSALAHAGERDQARECFVAAAALARDTGDHLLFANAALGYAGFEVTIIAIDERSVALLEEALASVPEHEVALRSRLLARLAIEQYYAPSRDRSEALSAQAVAVARGGSDHRALAAALGARHVALWRPDRLTNRLEAAEAMITAAQAAQDGPLELQARNWRAVDLFELGDLDGWREEARRHGDLAERLRIPAYLWYEPLWTAVDAILEGRFSEAGALRQQARELGIRAGDGNADLFAGMLEFVEHILRGTFDQLDLDYAADKIERSAAGVSWIAGYAWTLAILDRHDEARAYLARLALDRFTALPFDTNWLSAIGEASDAIIRMRDPTHARVLYELLIPYAGRPLTSGRAVVSYGAADRHLAGLAALLGRPNDATSHFEAAVRINALTPVWLVHTQIAFAEHLHACGDPDRGAEFAQQATSAAVRLGLSIDSRLRPATDDGSR